MPLFFVPRFSRRALLRSLPLALPLLYGCGGGNNDSPRQAVSRAAAPLVVNGETIAQIRIVQTSPIYNRSTGSAPPITTRLIVENTGARTIADLQFFFVRDLGDLSVPAAVNALAPGQVYQNEDFPLGNGFLGTVETLVSRLQFGGEAALGGPLSGVVSGNCTATGARDRMGRVYAAIGVDNQVRGFVEVETNEPYINRRHGSIVGTIDASGSITAILDDSERADPSPLSGTLRAEGDGLRFEFSVAPAFSGAERFSAFLQRSAQ